jgi:environmental stress-induced protein Ves
MGNFSILTPNDFVSMPWKNGLGHTVEIIRKDSPGDADFVWRLSMADVTTDGEFSNFKGYDRTLLLLEGNGITLTHASGQPDVLETPLQVAHFKGDESTIAKLHNGPIKDFNVMTRRTQCTAEVITCVQQEGRSLDVDANNLFVYAVNGELKIDLSVSETIFIPGQHLLVAGHLKYESIHCSGAAFIVIQINDHIERSI